MEDQANSEVIVCEICKAYSATGPKAAAKLRGHRMKCRPRETKALDMKSPEELQAELGAARAQLAALQKTQMESETPPELETQKDEPKRRERIPFGVKRQRFKAPDDPTKYFRVFNEGWERKPNRVKEALAAGYEPVEGFSDQGVVGVNNDGTPIKGVLMQIPKEWHEEDEALKEQERAKTDASINAGTFKAEPTDRRYIPTGIPGHLRTQR